MTQLYRLDANAAMIARAFDCWTGEDPWAGGYIAPGNFAPVITAGREFIAGPRTTRGQRRMVPRIWGVPPPPAADDMTRGITSVRNADSPFWIGNLRNSEFRCLVPATSFMEWGAGIDVEGRRNRHEFRLAEQRIFAFAGVWKDSEIPTFAILTCPAAPHLRSIGRDRMPVILPADPKDQDLWLHGEWKRASKFLTSPQDTGLMEMRG